ncbi:dihydrolipoamide acetyltransferase family protein [Aquimarina agarilytica]|uniref:dihydrolipoamide acetyltransferase family protein n=1 Tax=Aquimarina agarilytica TaxID=1087449 RepID=UPI00028A229B|nr:dihydrolipoamide acetyltransferase family protein [Aquimarina agarilytica]
MAKYELKLPKMGESVAEASVTTWLKEVGDTIEADDIVLEIATDKVDTEVPCEIEGVLREKLFEVGELVKVGQTIAIIDTDGVAEETSPEMEIAVTEAKESAVAIEEQIEQVVATNQISTPVTNASGRFYSPLVRNIANEEGLSDTELDSIQGTGVGERVTKNDILEFISLRKSDVGGITKTLAVDKSPLKVVETNEGHTLQKIATNKVTSPVNVVSGQDEVIEMSRMGKIISQHMTKSLETSAHVQSFIEADVTNVWKWRAKVKDEFMAREGEKMTFTPIFMEVIAQALKEFPMMNIAVDGDKIVKKKNINIGMAAALPDGNLIVPVIKNADQLNMVGMAKTVNDLANRARKNQLNPDDIQGGTYTVTNIGSFGTVMGTPIINQPQVGILALGAIRKVPAVIETPDGDFIGIRQRMFLSHSYDHRVVNGALGGQFVQRVKQLLEDWDVDRLV